MAMQTNSIRGKLSKKYKQTSAILSSQWISMRLTSTYIDDQNLRIIPKHIRLGLLRIPLHDEYK